MRKKGAKLKNMKITLDYEEIKGGEKRMVLPQMFKP
mgnify:CR=1 FL=1|tara:strand:+ start:295 stop:402 length:108 start_codon:yes stop_codon:yes gene_type:complete